MIEQQKILKVFRLINLLKSTPGKTLRQLSQHLEVSERTVRRYFELLEEIGFIVEKHIIYKTFFIADYTDEESPSFTSEESAVLNQLVKSLKHNPLQESLLKKLYAQSDLSPLANDLTKAHLSKVISTIDEAIKESRQIVLKNYSSLHSSSISDRTIEPIGFTENYSQLDAFDIQKNAVRTFKTERISDIEVLETPFKNAKGMIVLPRDIFGNTGDSEYEITLELSFLASLLMKEEFPTSGKFITANDDKYIFKGKVRHLEAVARFVLGLIEEIKVLGSEDFIGFLNKKIANKNW